MTGPLAGIRILDLTSVVAGPMATQMLGDMGADVIKIESPEGDAPRHTGPARSPGMAGEPLYAPMILVDKTCALAIAGAVSAALFARERNGRGQFVEIPMFESMVSFVLGEHLFGHNFVPPMGSLGYTRVLASWRRPYKSKDAISA